MENNNYNAIVDYLSNEIGIDKKKININKSLSDLGLDGDDVAELLLKFFKTFNIEYNKDSFNKFIPKESGFFINTLVHLFFKKEPQIENEIYIKDLVSTLDNGYWGKKHNNM
ncbi:hypothetical protein CO230_07600 [Chryseobacterium sp. 6424]|uniref:DUF1493 family protein n=1 Tax=Chryseobacterium sp. 6424 TaxID=2039166 RepID=UPI000EFAAFED|nr:DUF1493 family protein [Chryseobacterium sp. 6424]AYO58000.1 hypothetical protein CO230_07600 [Chryseobacterium sp. 6424]